MKQSNGMVLFVTLVMLLLLTMIGTSSVQITGLQGFLSRNVKESSLSQFASEAALNAGENTLDSVNISNFTFPPNQGLWAKVNHPIPPWYQANVWDNTQNYIEVNSGIPGLASEPRYMIEHINTILPKNSINLENSYGNSPPQFLQIFRVTARGVGANDNTITLTQSIFAVIAN